MPDKLNHLPRVMNGREVQSSSDGGPVARSDPGVPQAGRTAVRASQHAQGASQSQVCGGVSDHTSQNSHVSQHNVQCPCCGGDE